MASRWPLWFARWTWKESAKSRSDVFAVLLISLVLQTIILQLAQRIEKARVTKERQERAMAQLLSQSAHSDGAKLAS
jgi:hypothetical protein